MRERETREELDPFRHVVIKVDAGIDPLQGRTDRDALLIEISDRGKISGLFTTTGQTQRVVGDVTQPEISLIQFVLLL